MALTAVGMQYLTASTTTPTVWHQWTSGGTTISPIGWNDANVWKSWTTTGTTTGTVNLHYDADFTWHAWETWELTRQEYYNAFVPRQPTQEELDAAQRWREEASARTLAAQRKLQGAQDRALVLLRSLLTEDQVADMDTCQEVWVQGNEGGLYVIETDGRVHGNIRAVDEHGCLLGRLCVQPGMYDRDEGAALPTADGYVGQLLAIKFNERVLRETANWSSRQTCRQLRAA